MGKDYYKMEQHFLVTLIVIMLILGITYSSPAPSLSSSLSSNMSPLYNTQLSRSARSLFRNGNCSRNTPCMWAYCRWSPRVLLENDDCKYIQSICVCQWDQTCSRTNDVRPHNNYLTVPFVCK